MRTDLQYFLDKRDMMIRENRNPESLSKINNQIKCLKLCEKVFNEARGV
jgi:hypothetical protein